MICGFIALATVCCLSCCQYCKFYHLRTYGPKLWDPFIEPSTDFGFDVSGESLDACLNFATSGHSLCSVCCCLGLFQCECQNTDTHPTRYELWNAAADEGISDADAVEIANKVLARSKSQYVLGFNATYYPDNRCKDCNTGQHYLGSLECFAIDWFFCCQTGDSLADYFGPCLPGTWIQKCNSPFVNSHWREARKRRLEHAATSFELACINGKPKLAALLFDTGILAGANIWKRIEHFDSSNGGVVHLLARNGNRVLFKTIADRVKVQNQEYAYSSDDFLSKDKEKVKEEIPIQLQPFQQNTRESLKYKNMKLTQVHGSKTFTYISEHASKAEQEQTIINIEKKLSPRPTYKTYIEIIDGETDVTWLMFHGSTGWAPLTCLPSKKIMGVNELDDVALLGSEGTELDDVALIGTAGIELDELAQLGSEIEHGKSDTKEDASDANVITDNFRKIYWLDFRDDRGRKPIDVARDNGHIALAYDMQFIKEPNLTAELVRDASVWPLFIQTDSFKTNGIKSHIEDFGEGLLRIASRQACQNVERTSNDAEAVDKIADHVGDRVNELLATSAVKGPALLPERLRPVKQLLQDYVQVPLYFHTCICINPTRCDCVEGIPLLFRVGIFDPSVEIIRNQYIVLIEEVRGDPGRYIDFVAEQAMPDAKSYDGMREKALWDGGQQQYNGMIVTVKQTHANYAATHDAVCVMQPTSDPLELTILFRKVTPSFQSIVATIGKTLNGSATERRDKDIFVKITHRPMCKGLYRIIEKCLLKSAKNDTLHGAIDCSKVKDVAGCLISCPTFGRMQEVLQALYAEESWDVCELKCTWEGLSKAGWRDYKVIVKFNGLLFEIQVALEIMMRSRNYLDGHVAYEKFRNIYECVKYVGGYEDELNDAVNPNVVYSRKTSSVLPGQGADPLPSSAAPAESDSASVLTQMANQLHAFQGAASMLDHDEHIQNHIDALQAYISGLQTPSPEF